MRVFLIYAILFTISASRLFGENITVIGIGRLGLCFALCLEKAGYKVIGVDTDESYIDQINKKTVVSQEPFVSQYLKESKNFHATTSLVEGLNFSDSYFIVVPTNSIPGLETYDHTILTSVLEKINSFRVQNKHIVICSTIFPGYIRNIGKGLISDCLDTDISYNPEFIAQGNIINGMLCPDIVLIGEGTPLAGDKLLEIHQALSLNQPYIARMSVDSAEIAKLSLNCFVTAKIAFANFIGDLADETPGADKFDILTVLGQDKRIGSKCLMPGYGFGGPCFPRDNRALGNYAEMMNVEPFSLRATDALNRQHAAYMTAQFLKEDLDEYIFEDVSYKQNCPVPIIEASQKLEIALQLALAGKKVIIQDREEVLSQIQAKYNDTFIYKMIK